jgi:hypothetical protein
MLHGVSEWSRRLALVWEEKVLHLDVMLEPMESKE